MDAIDAMDESGLLNELRGAIEALSEGFAVFDADDRLMFFNTRFGELTPELSDFVAPGMSWSVYLSEAERRGFGEGIRTLDDHLAGEFIGPSSIDVSRPGDRIVCMTIQPTASGGFVLTETDVTEARGAEALRDKAQDMLRRFFDAAPINLLAYDEDNRRFIQWTPAWEELYGPPGDILDIWVDPADRADYLAELLARHYVDGFEARLIRADGAEFPARISARLIEYESAKVTISTAVDMTKFYQQRDELTRQRESSFQTEKLTALGELLAGVAHELNNPLSVVVGQALMLREEVEDPSITRRIEKISGSAERCSKIVKTFLAMARQKPVTLAPVSLNSVVETALDVAAYGLRTMGATVETDLAEVLPAVLADEDQIAQVFVNLIVNAEQALADKGAESRVVLRTWLDEASGQVMASVSDNGPGVPPAMRARVFEPFFTTKGIGKGTGVGLALCHRIVGTHGGTLELDESDEGGARFTFALPRAPEHSVLDAVPPSAEPKYDLTALIVEDEDDIAEMISEMLRAIGIKSLLASSAERGLDVIASGLHFDLILSDLKMPGIGGSGLLDAVRKRSPGLAKRIAFITGDAMSREADEIRKMSGCPLLEKPVAPHELRAVVHELINADGKAGMK